MVIEEKRRRFYSGPGKIPASEVENETLRRRFLSWFFWIRKNIGKKLSMEFIILEIDFN